MSYYEREQHERDLYEEARAETNHAVAYSERENANLHRTVERLTKALQDWHDMFEWGDFNLDFSNGVTDNGIDEGGVKGNAMLKDFLEQTRKALGKVGE